MNTPLHRAPQAGKLPANAPHAALLIDFDNVTMGIRSDLTKELKNLLNSDIIKGKVAVQRAYADWRRYPQYIVPLSEASVDLIFAPAYGSSKKNATDIRMAIDGMELVFTRPEIGTFILLTGDSDFSSLVLKLKEYGKYVIGVGIQESSSDILVQNCDEYYSYTNLAGLRKSTDTDRSAVDPWVLVERAVNQMADKGDVMRSDRLKQVMIEIDPGFDEGDFGYSKFSRFLTEASSKGLVQLKKLDNGQFEVGPSRGEGRKGGRREEPPRRDEPARESRGRGAGRDRDERGRGRGRREEAPPTPAPEPVEIPSAPRDRGPRRESGEGPLQAAYALLQRALEALMDQGREAIRDSDVKRRMLEIDSSFDEAELGFGKFSRFLRQAHDHEVIDLQKQEGGNYEVTLRDGGPRSPSAAEVMSPVAEREEPAPAREPEASRPPVEVSPSAPSATPVETGSRVGSRLGPRRGSTRRRRDQEDPPPLLEGQATGVPLDAAVAGATGRVDVDATALGLPTDRESQIRYLTNYRGVGRKTAEALVEGFGGDLFEILQNEPERVEEFVPATRAEQVLEGWKADFQRRAAEGPPVSEPDADEAASGAGQPEAERRPGGGRRRSRRGSRGGRGGSGR